MVKEDIFYSQNMIPSPNAFIIYRPEVKIIKEVTFQNKEATKILTYPSTSTKGKEPFPDIVSLCSKWKNLLVKKSKEMVESEKDSENKKGSTPLFLKIIRSGRRRYVVRGMVLLAKKSENEQEPNYLFLLDRICPEKINIPLIARQWQLSSREQDIVRLLLADRSNKEISHLLGLSINTIKFYLKLLMRKLKVSSRAGIVSYLLTKQPVAQVNEDSIITD